MPSLDLTSRPPQGTNAAIQLGLHANWQQFTLLVIINAFVGGMVGLERSIVPLLGLGTALVYPTLLAAVSDVAHPDWRASREHDAGI